MFFGGLPVDLLHGKQEGVCEVKSLYEWECSSLLKVKVTVNGNDVYMNNNNNKVLLSVDKKDVYVPKMFIESVHEEVFRQYVDRNRCERRLFAKRIEFLCEREVVNEFGKVVFEFREFEMMLNGKDVFACGKHETKCKCVFVYDTTYTQSDSTWMFGISVLSHFAMMFDYDLSRVSFYSDTLIHDKRHLIPANTNTNNNKPTQHHYHSLMRILFKIIIYINITSIAIIMYNDIKQSFSII